MIAQAMMLALLAGCAIPLGALLSKAHFFHQRWQQHVFRHTVIGLGAGALIAAVALVLIPDGAEKQPMWSAAFTFLVGALGFMVVDIYLKRSNSHGAQLIAMLLDFIPEAIAVGAMMTQSMAQAIFITIIIACQNVPEGFAAFTEMRKTHSNERKLLMLFVLIGLTGPIYVFSGLYFFGEREVALGALMTFCAGGILYLVIQDIAPKVAMKNYTIPAMGTVCGFTIGLIGYLYLHSS